MVTAKKKVPSKSKALRHGSGQAKKIVAKKSKTTLKKPKKSSRKTKKEVITSAEIIFDSNVGNTDSLFVDLPAQAGNPAQQAVPATLQLEPAVNQASADFNILQNKTIKENKKPGDILNTVWQKIVSLFKQLKI